jgi:ABC-type transporter Mla MlaB component
VSRLTRYSHDDEMPSSSQVKYPAFEMQSKSRRSQENACKSLEVSVDEVGESSGESFGQQSAFTQAWRRTSQLTLRITVEENSVAISIKLEGRVVGPWAAELGAVWSGLAPSITDRNVSLDLSDVTFVDDQGMSVLRHIYEKTNADFETGSPLTEYFADKVRNDDEHDQQKKDGDESHV